MKTLSMLFILFIVIYSCTTESKTPDSTSPVTREIRELSLAGTGYDLGLQHGQQLKSEISDIVSKWKENTTSQLNRDADEVLKDFINYSNFTENIKKWTPDLYEEIRGIADGSGQNFNNILVLNLLDEFWVYLNNPANHHCSNIGVPSMNGKLGFVAQNMDIEEYTDGYQTIMRLNRTAYRPEQLILTHPGLIALNGLNEAGVGVVVNTIMQLKASATGLPVAFVIRRILSSTDKAELLNFVQNVPHASGQNYIIGVEGEVFSFEASANQVVRFNPGNLNGTVYHTNHPIVNNDVKDWFKEFNPELPDSHMVRNSNSNIRLEALKKRIVDNDKIDDSIIKEALRSRDDKNNPICRTNAKRDIGFTFASVIMTLGNNPYFQMTAGPPDESEYQRFDFSKN